MDLLIPDRLDLAGWGGVAFAALALTGLGRLLTAGRAAPEAALVAGWGGAALALTLWGVATPLSLRYPAVAVAVLGLAGLAARTSRLARGEWRGIGRIIVLALPLLAVMASARPSEPDTFLNLLPNAAYLFDHASFPADGRPPAFSYLPAAPYNLQLFAFIASLVTPHFPTNALIGVNLVLQFAAALLLARLVARTEDAPGAVPPWDACALGLLLVTGLNPGFVPRYDLSGYSEPSVTVATAFAGWFAAQALDRIAEGRPAAPPLALLALTLAALDEIKQDSIALAAALLVSAGALVVLSRSGDSKLRVLGRLALAASPAALLYLAWRWYVLVHAAGGELTPQPVASWQVSALPLILWRMIATMGQKFLFYAVLAAAVAAMARHLRRRGLDLATRATALLAGCFVLYSAALIFAYVALFPGTMGTDAHSYFRYSTHLSLLLMVAIVLLVRAEAAEQGWKLGPRRRLVATGLVVAMLASPVAFLRLLRFDLEPPALRVWALARDAAPLLGDRDRLALLLPGDNGSVAAMLGTVLRTTPPRRPDLALAPVAALGPDTLAALDAEGYRLALISCAPPGFGAAPAGEAALLERAADGWHAKAAWRYEPVRRGRWSHVLSYAPLCLPDAR